jgi:hypothetical protein
MRDAAPSQHVVQRRGPERALAWFDDHGLAVERHQLGDDVVAPLAVHQNPSHRTLGADAHRGVAAVQLCGRTVGQVRPVAFPCVQDADPVAARPVEQRAHRGHDGAETRDVVAERRAEAPGLDEVALHVDDDQRGAPRLEPVGIRLRGDLRQ